MCPNVTLHFALVEFADSLTSLRPGLIEQSHNPAVIPPQGPGTSSVGLSVQFIEIYNDKIRDLLHPGADSSAFRVREHPQTGPYIENLIPVEVRARQK